MPVKFTALMFTVPLALLVKVTVCGAELVKTAVLGNATGDGKAVALYAAIVPERPTNIEPAEVATLTPPEIVLGAEVGNGLSFTVIVQLLAAGRLMAHVVADIKNSVGDALGAPKVIAAAAELLRVIV